MSPVVIKSVQLADTDMHDANLHSLQIDYVKNRAELEIEYYPEGQASKDRVPAKLIFEGVRSVQHMADFRSLKKNASAGQVSFWHCGKKTYIYLLEGILAVEASSVVMWKE